MRKPPFPGNGEVCQNPNCQLKTRKWEKNRVHMAPVGEKLLDAFLRQKDALHLIEWSHHAEMRSFQRAFSITKLMEVIENGWVIQYNRKENTILLLGYTRLGEGVYRPFHIPIVFRKQKDRMIAFIKTGYDPKASAHLWNETFEIRVCWCKPYEMENSHGNINV